MLTKNEEFLHEEPTQTKTLSTPSRGNEPLHDKSDSQLSESETKTSPIKRMLRLEWLGQTAASICWIVSVFSYGIEKTGDWLQLAAASAWLLANIATILFPNSD